jgi:hypothetical protein
MRVEGRGQLKSPPNYTSIQKPFAFDIFGDRNWASFLIGETTSDKKIRITNSF